jgi:hypothetical protein
MSNAFVGILLIALHSIWFLRITGLYMFRALYVHLQEAFHKRHLVYWVRIMSVGCGTVAVKLTYARNIQNAVCAAPPEDEKDITRTQYTQWRSWLRHCTTNRKVAGSILDGIIGIFHWHYPSGRTMALGLTQGLTEMSTRNISWGRRADNLTTFMCRLSWNLGTSTSWNPQGLSRPVMGLLYLYCYYYYYYYYYYYRPCYY